MIDATINYRNLACGAHQGNEAEIDYDHFPLSMLMTCRRLITSQWTIIAQQTTLE